MPLQADNDEVLIEEEKTSHTTLQAWVIVICAALFFFYEFIQMNMFNAISMNLMEAFHTNAEQLGVMSSFYFIANVVFLLIAGVLLDRCATRRVILLSLGVCIIGTAFFSFSDSFAWACVFRFLTGIGSAFCFLSVIRLASRWFPAQHMALVTGVVVTMAMLGGWVAQAPLTLLVDLLGWRHALLLDACLGVIIFMVIVAVVKDYPSHHHETHLQEQEAIAELGYWKSMRMAFLSLQNWLGGIYSALMNLPVGLLGGLWGTLYLVDANSLSKLDASMVSSMLFLGTILGSPLSGWLSDKMGYRRPLMFIGAILSLVIILIILSVSTLPYIALLILFFLLGVLTSTQIISYALVAESSLRIITAMSVSIVSLSVQGSDLIFQPFFGYLIDRHVFDRLHHMTLHFIPKDFSYAMLIFPVGFIVAFFAVLLLRETRCRQV